MKQRYVFRTCPCGPIKGIGTDTLQRYKGIRYAAAGRWEAPVEVTDWEGTYDATAQGDLCCQWGTYVTARTGTALFYYNESVEKPTYTYSEDCLNLNIWTPASGEQMPVLVYIHGGS
jgi:para-nitrobenzyl esterase